MEARPLLLVEDDENDVFLTLRTLKTNGFSCPVETVTDGEQALERFQDDQAPLPVAVLLDLHLPYISGRKLLRLLRQVPRTQSLPVITMLSSEEERRRLEPSFLPYGHVVCLVKPLDFPAFENALSSLGVNGG